jgi:hypothetical protein
MTMDEPDRLDRLLLDDAHVDLGDDGFTLRVMGALPAPAPKGNVWLRPALVMGSTALGCILAAAFAPAGTNVFQGFVDLAQMRGLTSAAITGLAMGAMLVVCALVLTLETD